MRIGFQLVFILINGNKLCITDMKEPYDSGYQHITALPNALASYKGEHLIIHGGKPSDQTNNLILKLERTAMPSLLEALEYNETIREIDLSSNSIGDKGIKLLCETFNKTPRISRIILKSNQFDIGLLCKGLTSEFITDIDVEGNNIQDKGIETLASWLQQSPSVKTIHLGSTGFGLKGMQALGQALKKTSITSINLSENEIDAAGIGYLTKGLQDSHITTLNLYYNNIGNTGIRLLCPSLKNITSINLSWNKIGLEGIKDMCQMLKYNDSIVTCNLSGHEFDKPNEVIPYFVDALQLNYTLKELYIGVKNDQISSCLERNQKFKKIDSNYLAYKQHEDININLSPTL